MKTDESIVNKYIKNEFVYKVMIIDPLLDIISKLEKGEFRDCDMKWLNANLNKYVDIALCSINNGQKYSTLINGVNLNNGLIRESVLNEFNKERFIKAFKILLEYFRSIKD